MKGLGALISRKRLDRFLIRLRPALAYWTLFYASILFLAIFILILRWPIEASDFDLWFHLTAGRYIWQNHAIPVDTFFSFLHRPLIEYSWLFDAGIYPIYEKFGYPGLIVLRSCFLAATLGLIGLFLFERQWARPSAYSCVLFAFYSIFFVQRFNLVRPHIFSYFCIIAFLYILEYRPDWVVLLPVLAVIWGNMHGVYFAVMIPILAAYIVEYYIQRLKVGEASLRQQRMLAFCGLAMAAFFLTPFGPHLLDLPVGGAMDYVSRHTREGIPIRWLNVSSLHVIAATAKPLTIFNFILYAAVLSALAAAARRRLKVRHFLLLAWGIFLITRLNRFEYECLLLALPLLKAEPFFDGVALKRLMPKPVLAAILAVILALPFFYLRSAYGVRPRYPLSLKNIPHGVADFLNRVNVGGSVLNFPNAGGYYEWALYPRYRIGMNMQVPAPFNDSDFYLMQYAFSDAKLLSRVISDYHPDFIAAPIGIPSFFKEIAPRFPDYVPVFFDDEDVLFVSKSRHPGLAREYLLPADAFNNPPDLQKEKIPRESSGCALPIYLARLIALNPESVNTQQRAAEICAAHKDFPQELAHADVVVRSFPNLPIGYLLKGKALRHLGNLQASLVSLKSGLKIAGDDGQSPEIDIELANTYLALKQPDKAKIYQVEATDTFPPDAWFEQEAEEQGRLPRKQIK